MQPDAAPTLPTRAASWHVRVPAENLDDTYIYIYIHIYTYVCACMCDFMYLYISVYTYIYIYLHVFMLYVDIVHRYIFIWNALCRASCSSASARFEVPLVPKVLAGGAFTLQVIFLEDFRSALELRDTDPEAALWPESALT